LPRTLKPTPGTIASLTAWYAANGRHDLPWRARPTPYRVLVSEFMLQQTQVGRVLPFFDAWMRQFPSFQSLADVPLDSVLKAWEGLGYYRRARSLHALAKSIVVHRLHRRRGDLNLPIEKLQELPGIGPYTAAAMASFAFNRPEPAIDTNVRRVVARLAGLHGPVGNPDHSHDAAVGHWMRKLMGSWQPRDAMAAVMDFGAMMCRARNPDCEGCPLRRGCRGRMLGPAPPKEVKSHLRNSHTGSKAKVTHAIGLIRDNRTLLLPIDSITPMVTLDPANGISDPRAAIKNHYLIHHQVPVAVRPEYSRIHIRGKSVSVHRCSILLSEPTGFQPASSSHLKGLPNEVRHAASALGLVYADGTAIIHPVSGQRLRQKSNSKRV
jgi:A/G-specific adenine glycosylase